MLGRPKFVLASGSPRRLALLNQAGIEPDALRPADVDETPSRGELPRACATRLARAKADAALKSDQLDDELRGEYNLAADTEATFQAFEALIGRGATVRIPHEVTITVVARKGTTVTVRFTKPR